MRRALAAVRFNKAKRRGLIPLENWYGTGSGSDLAPCRRRLPGPPGRYRSLYRTVLRIRQRYQSSRRSILQRALGKRIKSQKIGFNQLYPRHQRSMNPYIHLIIALMDAQHISLFPNDQDRKCSRLHAALGTPARFGRRNLLIFGRRQKDLLSLRIEGHRLRARLRLHRSGILVVIR
jgi:hypothetical protein